MFAHRRYPVGVSVAIIWQHIMRFAFNHFHSSIFRQNETKYLVKAHVAMVFIIPSIRNWKEIFVNKFEILFNMPPKQPSPAISIFTYITNFSLRAFEFRLDVINCRLFKRLENQENEVAVNIAWYTSTVFGNEGGWLELEGKYISKAKLILGTVGRGGDDGGRCLLIE